MISKYVILFLFAVFQVEVEVQVEVLNIEIIPRWLPIYRWVYLFPTVCIYLLLYTTRIIL